MKKKILPLLVCLLFVLPCLALPAGAASTTAAVSNATASPGQTVSFTVTLPQGVAAKSGGVTLSYDKSVLTLQSGTWNVSNAILSRFDMSNEVGAFAFSSASSVAGTVFTATFTVSGSAAAGSYPVEINLQLRDGSNTAISVTNTPGVLTVLPASTSVTVAVNSVSASRGEYVTFSASLLQKTQAKSGAVSLQYDPSVLQPVSGSWHLTNPILSHFDLSTASGAFAYSASASLEGELFSAVFLVLDSAPGGESTVSLNVRLKDESNTEMDVTNLSGSISVLAGNDLTVLTSSASAQVNSVVSFTATLSAAASVKSGAVTLVYDDSILELISGEWMVQNTVLNTFDVSRKVGAFAYANVTQVEGVLFTATFRVKEDAPVGESEISLAIQLRDNSNQSIFLLNTAGKMKVKPLEIISVSIVWGEMSFTYTDGSWNAQTHDYEVGEWQAQSEGGENVTLENEGNVAVVAQFSYTSTMESVTGTFSKDTLTLAAGEGGTTAIKLSGRPSRTLSKEKIGAITVKISKLDQEG